MQLLEYMFCVGNPKVPLLDSRGNSVLQMLSLTGTETLSGKGQEYPMEKLRQRAEERVRAEPDPVEDLTPDQMQHLIQELRVHQVELEIQNEELRATQETLNATRNHYAQLYEQYAQLYDFAPVGYCTLDTQGVILDVNFTLSDLLEIERSSLHGSRLYEYMPESDRDLFFGHLRALFASGERQTSELRMKGMKGQQWYLQLESRLAEDGGDPPRCLTALLDISQRKEAEQGIKVYQEHLEEMVQARTAQLQQEVEKRTQAQERLARSEQEFRTLAEHSPWIITRFDRDFRHVYVNQVIEKITGVPRDEFLGKTNQDLGMPAELVDLWHTQLEEIFATGTESLFEFDYPLSPEGRRFEAYFVPEFADDGRVEFVLGITRDITERAQYEEQLKAGEVRYRKLALENERLLQQARYDADTKEMLLHEVNHRVGNHLTAIAGLLSLERRHLHSGEPASYQEIFDDMAGRINSLARVHDMLSTSEWLPLAFDELIRRVVHSTLEFLLDGTDIVLKLPESPILVSARQAQHLALIINELTTNTMKYALQGRDLAHIRVEIRQEGEEIYCEFQDDGPGYPQKVLEWQQERVGLELIRKITRRNLSGRVSLRNDQGAVTTLCFPVDIGGGGVSFRS